MTVQRTDKTIMTTTKLTPADLIVLSLLLERPMHGYELAQEYDRQEVRDWASVSKAQVYYALKKLEKSGLITASPDQADGDPRGKTSFRVTPRGKSLLQAHLVETHWIEERRPQPFTTWTGLSIHCPEQSRSSMFKQRREFLSRELLREGASYEQVAAMSSDRSRAGLKIIKLTISLIETEIAWLDSLDL